MVERTSQLPVLNTHPERAGYRGRLAPSPTGYMHLGHARTFWIAQERAKRAGGKLILRMEDLDPHRCRTEFATAILEDLRWIGLDWDEGPDVGGPFGPYVQSQRLEFYRTVFSQLKEGGFLYPCTCSRKDVLQALGAPHAGEDEPIYPGACRPDRHPDKTATAQFAPGTRINWRFRIPDGRPIRFKDRFFQEQEFVAGKDFGDFVVWRHDDIPAYHLAVVADDIAMQITEVVRGQDLLRSTARQLLLYEALGKTPPEYFHCPLVTDDSGVRLAKRHDALSLRKLRAEGHTPEQLRSQWLFP